VFSGDQPDVREHDAARLRLTNAWLKTHANWLVSGWRECLIYATRIAKKWSSSPHADRDSGRCEATPRTGPGDFHKRRVIYRAGDIRSDRRLTTETTALTERNLTIFRLVTCCSLRAREIAGLRLSDVRLSLAKPIVNVPKQIAKLRIPRTVPPLTAAV
jgi:integrase